VELTEFLNGFLSCSLSQPAQVSADTKYALVVSSAKAPKDGSFYDWSASLNDPYPGGAALGHAKSGQWSPRVVNSVPMDFAFKTFVDPLGTTTPIVTPVSPSSKTRDTTPTIKAIISDTPDNPDRSGIRLFLDDKEVTSFSYDRSSGDLSYTSKKLKPDKHMVKVEAEDVAGNHTTEG
jgi:hypothetical protein